MSLILVLFLMTNKEEERGNNRIAYYFFGIVILLELLSTFTRGPLIALSAATLASLLFSESRKHNKYLYIAVAVLGIIFSGSIWQIVSYRGLALGADFFQIPNVVSRIELIKLGLNDIFYNNGLGFGIGNTPIYQIFNGNRFYSVDNFTLQSIFEIGLWGTLIFYIMVSTVVMKFISLKNRKNNLSIYLFCATLCWLIFANTTSTSIYHHIPFESGIYFILIFSLFVQIVQIKSL